MTHQRSINIEWRRPASAPAPVVVVWGNSTLSEFAPALPACHYVLAGLDEILMGRLYTPKPPKKRSHCGSKGKIIARTVFGSLFTSKEFVPAASRRISSMGPRDSRDSTETNGNVHPAGRGNMAKVSRTSSNASLGGLTPEAVDAGTAAMRQLSKIFHFLESYEQEISDAESIYGLGIRQQTRINDLETTMKTLAFGKDQEMVKLQDENNAYKANARKFEQEREELKRERAAMDDTRKAMQSKVDRQKEMEINETKQRISDKNKMRIKQIRDEHEKKTQDLEKKIQDLQTDKAELEDTIGKLKERNIEAQEDLHRQKEGLEVDKRSSQSHIMRLESELNQINAASKVSPQTPEFYIEAFQQLWDGIRDVAIKDLRFLPEDAEQLDSDAVRDRLYNASAVFKYLPLSSESAVATSLRACAIQNFLSTKTISIIRRRYFTEATAAVERKSGSKPMDPILDAISNVPAASPKQDLSWRLMTVDKLDRLESRGRSATTNISTRPSQGEIVKEILALLHYFRSPTDQQLQAKLTEIAKMAIRLWTALRKDNCRVEFDYDTSAGDWPAWEFVETATTNGPVAATSPNDTPIAQLPSKSFTLFPRITGSFDSDGANPRILHAGLALPHNSPAFYKGLQEIEHIDHATKEFKRGLRRGSSVQSSPTTGKGQGDWPALPRG